LKPQQDQLLISVLHAILPQLKEREVQAIKEKEKRLKEKEIQQQESLVTEGTTLEACLVTEDVALEACLIAKGITMDDNLVAKESTDDSTLLEQLDECNSSMEKTNTVSLCFDSKEQHIIDECAFERAFLQLFGEEFSTVKRIFSQNMDQLEEQLTKEKIYKNDSKTTLTALMTPFQMFFHLEWPMNTTFKSRDDFQKYMGYYTHIFKETMIRDITVIEKYLIEVILHEHEIQKRLELQSNDVKINPVQALEASFVVTKSSGTMLENSSLETTFTRLESEHTSFVKESSSSEGNDADDDIDPSYDSDTVTVVPHSNNDTFENVFAHGIQNHEQPKSIPDTYVVNENNNNIIYDIPNMDPDRDKKEHDYVAYEQKHALFSSLINNLKCDVEKCNKIKLLNDEISNLKSQACEKDKKFTKENEKYDELQKVGPTDQTLRMLLPKEDNVNTRKQGLGFENQNDDVNPILLNKAKELAPCLYNIDEMGKDLLSNHKISSEEELKCEAEKRLKVKQRKSSLSYHGFVYGETQFNEPPKVPLERRDVNLKKHLEQAQLSNYDPNLWKSLPMKCFCYVKHAMLKSEKEIVSKQNPLREAVFINSNVDLQLNCFEKGLVKEMKDDFKYVTSLEEEFDEKCLILDIQTDFFKTQFESGHIRVT
ncbi:hypothetical protein Tco_0665938, partial [Tanacetum coccineum]